MVYILIYFSFQILAENLVKVGQNDRQWSNFKKNTSVRTLKKRVDSRRTFYALSNGVYINILFLSNIGRKFGQSWAK
jgi:hypothetical protein